TVENLTGGAAGDTFALNAALSGNASGAGGDDTFTLDGGSAGTIAGGADTDTIVGTGTANAFVVSAANAGTVNGGAFNTVENLTGGAAGDTFALNAALSGNASGAGGDDTFTLNGGSAGTIVGGTGTGDTIVGTAAANTFVVNAADAGTVNGGAFNTVENLTGGGSADTFTLTGALSGTASGAAGNDTFNVNNGGSAGTFDGGADTDTQTYAANTTGTVVVDFSDSVNVENFVGSANDDTFNMNTDIANGVTVNGGGGANDAFVVTAASNISGDLTVTNVDTVDVDASLSAQNVDIDSSGDIVINSDLDATDVLTLTSGGSITQSADTGIVTAQSLDASSVTGQTFTNTTVAVYNAINTGSGGIEIHNDGDLTLDLLCAGSGAGCQPGTEAGTGPVIVEATGNLYAVGGQTNIIGNSASLFAGGQMGTPSVPITFRGFPETGIPIDIHVSSTAIVPYIDAYAASNATADYAGGTGGAVAIENVKISQKAAASAALAAAIKEDTDVDWAAYSEDIT
ncbi:MAG: hypothetical protein MUP90_08825, partial [Gammaproteobacteria bacterium]|nr:hypothetical protein [Gammaproteobacteria bacterium]